MVRDIGSADRTKQNGVELAQLIGAICRHHDAMLPVVVRSPIEILKVQFELTVALGTGFKSLHTGRDNLRPNSISAHGGNPVSSHLLLLVLGGQFFECAHPRKCCLRSSNESDA